MRATSIEVQPFHYREMLLALSVVKKDSDDLETDGQRRPRVLIVNETGSEISSMFCAAGADVVTSDPSPTSDTRIPHFEGDGTRIQDAGFDLVIIRTPTLGVTRYTTPPKASFVAIESHSLDNSIRRVIGGTTQVVRPSEHGTGHSTPMLLYLSEGLPALRPTCVLNVVPALEPQPGPNEIPHQG